LTGRDDLVAIWHYRFGSGFQDSSDPIRPEFLRCDLLRLVGWNLRRDGDEIREPQDTSGAWLGRSYFRRLVHRATLTLLVAIGKNDISVLQELSKA